MSLDPITHPRKGPEASQKKKKKMKAEMFKLHGGELAVSLVNSLMA
jgi:hypothetical protein